MIGVDPEPAVNPGVLVRHPAAAAGKLLAGAVAGTVQIEQRTMVEAILDDGQSLRALNDLYIGDAGHQSARYRLRDERQSSSGILIGTGTGSTGWCASLALSRAEAPELPGPLEDSLAWFVREAWPSPFTGTTLTQGLLPAGQTLPVVAEGDLVVFGDGLETDRLQVGWGQQISVQVAGQRLALI